MIWIVVTVVLTFLISGAFGYQKWFYLDQITLRNFVLFIIGLSSFFIILQIIHSLGFFPEAVAGAFMANFYASLGAFFLGASFKQFQTKKDAGEIIYSNRSFWTDIVPYVVSIGLILFGIQRSSLLGDLPVTPIRLTSGASILCIGVWGFTIKLVPEFRKQAMYVLDRKISWDQLVTYQWYEEDVIEIDFQIDGYIKSFKTLIPEEDQREVENLLKQKMLDKLDQKETEGDSNMELY